MIAATAFAAALQLWAVEGALTKRQAPIINTPNGLVTCETTAITWTGGSSPFFVSVYPGGQQTGQAYIQFPEVASSPLQWDVNISPDTNVTIAIRDNSGQTNAAAPVVITAGPDTSCVNVTGTSSGSSGGSSGGSGGTSPTPSTTPSGTPSSGGSTPSATPSDDGGSGAGLVKAGTSTLVLGGLAALTYLF